MFTELFLTCLLPIAVVDRRDALRRTFDAVGIVESHGDPRAYNAAEDAAGIAGIRPIMVQECNRIIGYRKYGLEDRWSPIKSWEMFRLYSLYHAPQAQPEIWARNWNGGPKGHHKGSTVAYWKKVEAEMLRAGWEYAGFSLHLAVLCAAIGLAMVYMAAASLFGARH